jgi:hypothetical protein
MTDRTFPFELHDQLKYYVYRLIDPRTGQTFYVGKGKGNRVFEHAKNAIDLTDDDLLTDKSRTIQDIINSGLEVLHVIHRHGIEDESTAFEVEAALIEAYPGLTNLAGGHDNSERGCAHADELIRKYKMEAIKPQHNLLAISIGRSLEEGRSTYDAVRMFWRVSESRAKSVEYVLAHRSGIVLDVFIADEWVDSTDERLCKYIEEGHVFDPPRKAFVGRQAPSEILDLYRNTRLPAVKKGAASPIRYLSPTGELDQ